ncbi:hypothetical protein OTK49_02465 [Vibrio coralliirubri]|uniref:hypothetical protein n=1 Tax=Vibrio coralliirubri TaxID=1516159 RepID=UPI002283FFA1|nr:hypothetical protein [Vibrio coralliirubri]MCY9861380.1 hypothetical protein [Vibrio coralliirubri]
MKKLAELIKLFSEKTGIKRLGTDHAPSSVAAIFHVDDIPFEKPTHKDVSDILNDFIQQANKYEVKVSITNEEPTTHIEKPIKKTEKNSFFLAAKAEQQAATPTAKERCQASESRIKEARARMAHIQDEHNQNSMLATLLKEGGSAIKPDTKEPLTRVSSLVDILSTGGKLGTETTPITNSTRPKPRH